MFASENIEKWRFVGEIARDAIKYIAPSIRPGAYLIDICEKAENFIRNRGATPAFPVNISINEVAAHYTSPPNDKTTIPRRAVVKIDLGAILKSGEISDTAITVGVNINKSEHELIRATQEVLLAAIDTIKDGVRVGEVGRKIWVEAHNRGYGVLVDLGGHSIENWKLHAGITIPNVYRRYTPKLRAGMIVAIEPFLVLSKDDSHTRPDHNNIHIFSIRHIDAKKLKRDKLLGIFFSKFRTMPFTLRWINRAKEDEKFYVKLRQVLLNKYYEGVVNIYPALIESKYNIVAQFEHTILVKENSAIILTG